MRDRYSDLVNSGPGKTLAGMLGLPRPAKLRRYASGQPMLVGPAIVEGVAGAPLLPEIQRILTVAGADVAAVDVTVAEGGSSPGGSGSDSSRSG